MKMLYLETGDAAIRPDLFTHADLISVLTKNVTGNFINSDISPVKQLQNTLEQMEGLVHPSCWKQQGEICLSRMAWNVSETNELTTNEKISVMYKLRRLADHHSVKLDHTILLVFKNLQQMGSKPVSLTNTATIDD